MDRTFIIQPQSGLQFDWNAIAANPRGKHEPLTALVAYKAHYSNMISQARARGQEPVLVSLPVMDENRYFAYVTSGMSMQERGNVLYWLGGNTAYLRNLHAMYNLALFRLAAIQCVHIVDITTPMLADPRYSQYLEQDGMTLSAAGESLVNNALNKVRTDEAA